MSFDLDILRAFASAETYGRFGKYVRKSSLGEETYRIFEAMGEWYRNNPTLPDINWVKFGAWFLLVKHPKLDETKALIYRAMFSTLSDDASMVVELEDVISGLVTRDYAATIAEQALKVADGDDPKGMSVIQKMVTEWEDRSGKLARLEDSIVTHDILDVLKSVSVGGYTWRLNCLNDALGPLRKGDFIVIGTRPDTGKTTLLASESTFMATQMDGRPVLWLNNEEGGKKVMRRIVQSAIGWPTAKMETKPEEAAAEYNKLYGRDDQFIVYDNAHITTKDVEALCKKYNPGLIIFDQLWKVKAYESENEVTRLTMLFNWGREIAKEYAPVMTVHQADGTAEGQKWIDMSQLYMSKTGIQGEADAIITMGRSPDTANVRYLYVPKNKMSGGVPHLRNGKFEIEILGDTARFREPT